MRCISRELGILCMSSRAIITHGYFCLLWFWHVWVKLGCIPFTQRNRKFWLENQMVRVIPFGKVQKLWAAGWGDACFLFLQVSSWYGYTLKLLFLSWGQVKSFVVYGWIFQPDGLKMVWILRGSLETVIGKLHIWVWNRVRVWKTPLMYVTPHRKCQEVPSGINAAHFIPVSGLHWRS